jgi:hypothetical protein
MDWLRFSASARRRLFVAESGISQLPEPDAGSSEMKTVFAAYIRQIRKEISVES